MAQSGISGAVTRTRAPAALCACSGPLRNPSARPRLSPTRRRRGGHRRTGSSPRSRRSCCVAGCSGPVQRPAASPAGEHQFYLRREPVAEGHPASVEHSRSRAVGRDVLPSDGQVRFTPIRWARSRREVERALSVASRSRVIERTNDWCRIQSGDIPSAVSSRVSAFDSSPSLDFSPG